MTAAPPRSTAPAHETVDGPPPQVVAVTGALGGLGASSLLLHVARASAALGRRVAVLDLEPAGGLGLLLGDEPRPGLRWADLPADESAFRAELLVPALPSWLGLPVLTGDERGGCANPTQASAALAALAQDHDLILVDLPRGAEPPPGAELLLLTAADLRSAVAAQALAAPLAARCSQGTGSTLRLVLREGAHDVTAEDLLDMTGAEVAAVLPVDRSVAQRVARGDDPTRGRGGARRAARHLAALLAAASDAEAGGPPPGAPVRPPTRGRGRPPEAMAQGAPAEAGPGAVAMARAAR